MQAQEIDMKVIRYYLWSGICWRSRVLLGLLTVVWALKWFGQ